MADSYIDPFETQLYGKFAREQMAEVCIGRVAALDAMVRFSIETQAAADAAMARVIANAPTPLTAIDAEHVTAEAADVLVRFGSHLDSLKGKPVAVSQVYRGDAPSVLARRRLTKLSAGLGHVLSEARIHQEKIRDAAHWIGELEAAHTNLQALERQQRASKVAQVDLGPEVSTQRELWLATYSANKHLIRGLLAHIGKPELLPLIFDDLAEVHRVSGVTDEVTVPPVTPPEEG
jgi:hypothetical protein